MKAERVIILIDGSNLYHYLRKLGFRRIAEFDYQAFAAFLTRDRTLISATYYVGRVRSAGDVKGNELLKWQQRLAAHIERAGWRVEYGHMLQQGSLFIEKGVDVHMAVDLLAGSYENLYDTAIIVSSDTDLLPAIRKVRAKAKKIEYVGFAFSPSLGLTQHTDTYLHLSKGDLTPFLKHTY